MQYHCAKCGWTGEVNSRPHCLPCYAAAVKRWRKKHPENAKKIKREYYQRFKRERPEEYRARRRRLYLPATAKRQRQRRMEWLNSGTVTKQELREIFAMYSGKCAYCQKSVKPRFNPKDPRGFDHVKSRQNGGKHEKSNLVPCCRKCNELKG